MYAAIYQAMDYVAQVSLFKHLQANFVEREFTRISFFPVAH